MVAGPIWKDIMLGIHRGLPEQAFTPPTGATGYANVAPDVRNLTLAQACQVLTAAGFDVALNRTLADSDPLLAKNRVFGTDPAPGSLVGLGTTIAITMTAGSDLDVTFDGASPGHDGDPHASNPDDSGTPDGDDGSVTAAGGPARDLGGGIVTPSTGVTPRPGHGTKPH